MISVSAWFTTWMVKQTLHLVRKFVYDSTHESVRVDNYGSISRASDSITSGGVSLSLINTDQNWNKFLSDKTNLRQTGTIQMGIGIINTIARAGIGRAAITAANLVTLLPGSVISSGIAVPYSGEWIDLMTGWGDDPEFTGVLTGLLIRDKFMGLFEKGIGNKASPVDFFSTAQNPADLAWDILVTYGKFDSTASTANTDIDYTSWSSWWTDCDTANISLKARFSGENIRSALEFVKDLSNSGIFAAGDGKLHFFRLKQAAAPGSAQVYSTDNTRDLSVGLDNEKILNWLRVFYDLNIATTIVTNGTMEADANWTGNGADTNERSDEQVYAGTYSRKIVATHLLDGAYQDLTTVTGNRYEATARIYVTAGQAAVGIGTRRHFGDHGQSGAGAGNAGLVANHVMYQRYQAGFSGDIDRINIYLDFSSLFPYTVKCALYTGAVANTGTFIASTEERVFDSDPVPKWSTFMFSSPVTIVSGTWYQIAIWTPDSNIVGRYQSALNWYRHSATYASSWPTTLTSAGDEAKGLWQVAVEEPVAMSNPNASTDEWEELSFTFTAVDTTSRFWFESDNDVTTTFYADNVIVREVLAEEFEGSYLKEDPTSQSAYGLSQDTKDSTAVWHANITSATAYTDRRIAIYKDPLTIVRFTSFFEGMVSQVGDQIQVTDAFFSFNAEWFRIFGISDLNVNEGTITIEAADFSDITP